MQPDDNPANDRPHPNSPSFFDPLDPTLPPAPDGQKPPAPTKQPDTVRFAALRAGWTRAWDTGGVLARMWEDILNAPQDGFRHMARWIRIVLTVAAAALLVLLVNAAIDVLLLSLHHLAAALPTTHTDRSASHRYWHVIDTPMRSYIAHHSAGLSVSSSSIYTFWQLTGLFGLVGGFFGSTGARITWVLWATCSAGAVWAATPADSRPIATGIAVLAWALASTVALRGLSLRPIIHTVPSPAPIVQPQIEIRPEIHLPAQSTSPAVDDRPAPADPLQH
ncbi:hypothetical protein ABZ721_33120 [Streptomyces sp. NPDC006733]|uniref:hypothetical protein n=1 Tax=Streptomyces sp. NPDC006733 TaxID=3155460 RepID=UPI0033BFCB27